VCSSDAGALKRLAAEYPTPTARFSTANEKDTVIPSRVSPLELLHPDGVTKRSLVIGSNCPASLRLKTPTGGESADLILLAPTLAECRTKDWLEDAVRSLSQRLADHGIAYVLAAPRWRLRIKQLLYDHGLLIDTAIVHTPNLESTRYMVPLSPIPTRYAFSNMLPIPSWKRYLAMIGFRLPGIQKLLGSVLPSVGIVARRPGARALFDWLFRLDGAAHRSGSAVIGTSWRGEDGAVILHRFLDYDDQPSTIAKMNKTGMLANSRLDEAELLGRLGPGARSAGAQVPRVLLLGQLNDQPVLLETMVPGQSLASLLTSRPSRIFNVVERLVSWLERWNRSTMIVRPLEREVLTQELLAPAALLAPRLEQGEEYWHWLESRCATVEAAPTPFVATHNDLTMSNVLLDKQGRLGIVDWETAREHSFPLVDFFYAITDAFVVARFFERPEAFKACFTPGGGHARQFSNLLLRARRNLGISECFAELCLHACFLHHAVNEQRLSGSSDARPFFNIVQWLALNRNTVKESMGGSG
jgi:Phosphotransferase enzyme family